ncbi:MAG: ABC transporter substrate-binding protein [Clostridium sp.]
MVGKKKLVMLLCGLMLGTTLTACGEKKEESKGEAQKTVGIIQFVQHPALDEAYKGFVDGLKEKGFEDGKNIKLDFKNAQNKQDMSQTIASGFASDKKDLIFTIGTGPSQAAYNATKDIPIVITAVTDPVEAGIAKSMKKSETNVTGTSDAVPVGVQLDLLKKLVPDIKTIGFIYNTSEANSVVQAKQFKEEAGKLGYTVKEIGVTNVNEINQNLPLALGEIDALYAPTDNTVASAYDLVAKLCLDKKVPLFCGEEGGVPKGGLVTLGINYYNLGKEAGYKAAEVLNGKKPSDIEITILSEMNIMINEKTAKELNITIPDDIKAKAKMVSGETK